MLTTVVSLDPMYVYFNVDEGTLTARHPGDQRGQDQAAISKGQMPVLMALEGEKGFPHEGRVNFVNNQINPNTGSISVRGMFDNPKPPNGVRAVETGDVRPRPAADRRNRTRPCWSSIGRSARTRG